MIKEISNSYLNYIVLFSMFEVTDDDDVFIVIVSENKIQDFSFKAKNELIF